jgi:TetR/AcrR family transcriptional regulator, regulator of autoinduction and epiphytic fitness
VPPAAPATEPADGRVARSQRSRRAIIDAMRALNAEGDIQPTARRITERAGVSVRTFWQQFADMEALLVEATKRDDEILHAMREPIDPDEPLATRITLFVRGRARILEYLTPSWRAARLQLPFSAQLQSYNAGLLTMAKEEVEKVFAPELTKLDDSRRRQLIDGLHAISIWSFWESLRTEVGLGPRQARDLVRTTFAAMLAEAGFA